MVAVAAFAISLTGAQAAHAAPSASDLTKQIEQASNQLETVVESYNAMNINLQKTQSDLKTLEASLPSAQAALKAATAQVGNIAAASYQQGRIGPLSALLGGDSSDLMAKMSYLDQIEQSNQHDIDTYTQTTQTFAQRQSELKTTQAKQAAQLQAIAARKASIEASIKRLKAMRTTAYGQPTEPGHAYNGPVPDVSGSAGVAVRFAFSKIGKPYSYGAAGPNSYDCSGLTMAAWGAAGKSLPHNAAAQWGVVAHISRSDLEPGDLVFYRDLEHVGIYVGNDQIIDAPTYGKPVDRRSINRGMTISGYGRVT